MTMKRWTVIGKSVAPDGRVTLTLQDDHGTILTQDFDPDEMVDRVVRPGEQ